MAAKTAPQSPRKRFIAYLRVSTDRQGRSGLGLEAQHAAIATEVTRRGGILLADFTEIESGRNNERPQLQAALRACREQDATLIVAKLDRLARNTEFLLTVQRGAGTAGVLFCDLPDLPDGPVGQLMLTMMAAIAEFEAGAISDRIRRALAAAKVRGTTLGNPQWRETLPRAARISAEAARERARRRALGYADAIELARRTGAHTLQEIAQRLTERRVEPPGGPAARWHPATVRRVMRRLEEHEPHG